MAPPTSDRVLVEPFTTEFERLQRQKARAQGGVEARVLTNLCFYYGEQYIRSAESKLIAPKLDPNKLALIFNHVRKLTRRKIGRLSAIEGTARARPDKTDPKAFADADLVTQLVRALDEKVVQPMRLWEIYFWLCIGGVAVEYVPYFKDVTMEPLPQYDEATGDLLWKDQLTGEVIPQRALEMLVGQGRSPESFAIHEIPLLTGDVGSVIYGPLNIFVDAAVRDLQSLASDQSVMIAEVKTHGWIRETFGADAVKGLSRDSNLSIVKTQFSQLGPSLSGVNLRDLIPAVAGSRDRDDPDLAVVVTRFQPATRDFPYGRQSYFIPGERVLDDGDNPYEDIPLVDYHWDVAATSFWSGDFLSDLIPAQKFYNKRMSQLGEQANASIYDKLLLGPGLSREDLNADTPGYVNDGLSEQGAPMVARLPGPSLPGWFLDSIRIVSDYLTEVGGSDIFQRQGGLGQMRGPLSIPMMQEILDAEDGPLFIHMGERLGRVKQMRVNRVQQFYPPIRTLHYTGSNHRDEVLVFHTDVILKAGTQYNITIDRASLVPELFALREARLKERLSSPLAGLYLDPRTGKLDFSKIASDLRFGDWDRVSKEDKYRQLARSIIRALWSGQPPPDPMEFWNHAVIMDELEDQMIGSEFQTASTTLRQSFIQYYNACRQFLQARADRMQEAVQAQQIQSAVAQATQQAAAQAAAATVDEALAQVRQQQQLAATPPPLADRLRQALTQQSDPRQPPQP